jgi:membrane protein required for colicin V production
VTAAACGPYAKAMTALDIFLLLLMGYLGVRGFANGFVAESLALAAWVAAFLAVRLLHEPVASALADPVGTESGAAVLAVALIFGVVFGIGRFAAGRVGSATKASALGSFDRVLGFGFGAFKGLLAATIVFLIASMAYNTIFGGKSERPAWMQDARSYPLLNATSSALVDWVRERQDAGEPGNMSA